MRRHILLIASLCLVSACSSWLGDNEKAPLVGERKAVLQAPAADALVIAAKENEATPITVPEAAANTIWGQAFGYPTHNPGHLVAGGLSKRQWSSSIGKGLDKKSPLMPAPIIVENTVFAMDSKGQVTSLSLANGKENWQIATRGEDQDKDELSAGGGLAYGRNMLVATNGSRDVIGLNAQNGTELWRVSLPAPLRGAPTLIAGRAYIIDTLNRVIALDANTGTQVWMYSGIAEEIALLGTPSPAVDTNRVIAALSNGVVMSLSLSDGTQQWDSRFNSSVASAVASLTDLRDVAGPPVIDAGRVYAVNASGRVIALDAASGARLWQKDARATGSLWPAGDVVFMLTREGVAARRVEDGAILWEASLPNFEDIKDKEDPITWYGPYLLSGQLVSFGSVGKAMIFDPQTGKPINEIDIDDDIAAAPAIANGMAAFITDDGTVSVWK